MTSLTQMRHAVQRATRGLAWPAAIDALAAVAAGGLVPPAAAQAATPAYTITDLGNLGYPSSSPAGINTAGQVTGDSYLQATIPGPCPPRTWTAQVLLWLDGFRHPIQPVNHSRPGCVLGDEDRSSWPGGRSHRGMPASFSRADPQG